MRTLIPHKKKSLKEQLDKTFSEMWEQYVTDDLESDLVNIIWSEAKSKNIMNYRDIKVDLLIDLLHPTKKLEINKSDKAKT